MKRTVLLLALPLLVTATPALARDKVPYALDHGERYQTAHCPPGLAKKNPPCIPPGQAKKYRVGYPLTVPYASVPAYMLEELPHPRHGTRYVMVDRDVLLISEATKKVLDAVVIASAM